MPHFQKSKWQSNTVRMFSHYLRLLFWTSLEDSVYVFKMFLAAMGSSWCWTTVMLQALPRMLLASLCIQYFTSLGASNDHAFANRGKTWCPNCVCSVRFSPSILFGILNVGSLWAHLFGRQPAWMTLQTMSLSRLASFWQAQGFTYSETCSCHHPVSLGCTDLSFIHFMTHSFIVYYFILFIVTIILRTICRCGL